VKMPEARTLMGLAATLAVWATPIGLLLWLQPTNTERTELRGDGGAIDVGVIGKRSDDGLQPVSATLTWSESLPLTWRGQGGTVGTRVAPAAEIADGQLLFELNGQAVTAQTSGEPIFRDIVTGLTGGDVDWLDQMLMRRGFAAETTLSSTGASTRTTTKAVKAMQIADGDRLQDGVFYAEFTVFVTSNFMQGRVVPSPGTYLETGGPIISVEPTLVDVRLALVGPEARKSLVSAGAVEVRIQGSIVRLTSIDAPDLIEQFRTVFTDEATQPESVDGLILRRAPLEVGTTAATSIIYSADGMTACIIEISLTGGEPVGRVIPTPAEVAAEPGIVYVDSSLSGVSVVNNPSSTPDVSCN